MRIQHNIMAMNAYRNYTNNTNALSQNLEKLSSGYKINRAGDDAAGLAISEKMRAQITGLEQAQDNAKSGKNLVNTAEGALQEVHDMLNRMVKLADQSANGTFDDDVDRAALQDEIVQLKDEINRIADSANYNGIKLLDGSLAGGASASAKVGSTEMTFSVGTKDKTLGGAITGTAVKVAIANTANAGSVGASISASGVVTITLQQGQSYSADQITQLVRDAAKKLSQSTTAATKKLGDAFSSFNVSFSGEFYKATSITLATTAFATGTGEGLELQIGDTSDKFNQLNVSVEDMHVFALGIADISVGDQDSAQAAVNVIKAAINKVSTARATLGATSNRLDHTMNNLSVMTENIQDAESTIRDTDVAEEMMAYTKNNILVQSAQAMLAQANQVPQGVLQLLQ